MPKHALITGITGQDGSYLAELLLEKEYEVYGLARRSSSDPYSRIEHIKKRIKILCGNITDLGAVRIAMEESKPDEVYNLAAQSHVGDSFRCVSETMETNYYGALKIIDEAFRVNPDVRIYQASTSEMFGNAIPPQNELTQFNPQSPYAEAKATTHERVVVPYRDSGYFICSGFLFNHESPRRGKHFVTKKITYSFAKIAFGLQKYLELGNLDSKRDWGYAPDYVEAMWLMLQQEKPEDYVIATGHARTVQEFVDAVASAMNICLTWTGDGINKIAYDGAGNAIVKVNPEYFRPSEVNYLQGDSAKARQTLGWKPKTSFDDMVSMMVDYDIKEIIKLNTK